MELSRLDHVGIRVMDFTRAIPFYEWLGFAVIRHDKNAHVVVLRHVCGLEINLLDSGTDDLAGKNILMDVGPKYPGYTHVAIVVDSVEQAQRFLEAGGLEITEGPVTFGDGKTSIFVRDPDRNVIEFTQLPDR